MLHANDVSLNDDDEPDFIPRSRQRARIAVIIAGFGPWRKLIDRAERLIERGHGIAQTARIIAADTKRLSARP